MFSRSQGIGKSFLAFSQFPVFLFKVKTCGFFFRHIHFGTFDITDQKEDRKPCSYQDRRPKKAI